MNSFLQSELLSLPELQQTMVQISIKLCNSDSKWAIIIERSANPSSVGMYVPQRILQYMNIQFYSWLANTTIDAQSTLNKTISHSLIPKVKRLLIKINTSSKLLTSIINHQIGRLIIIQFYIFLHSTPMKRPSQYDNYRPSNKRIKKEINEPLVIEDLPEEEELIRFAEPKQEEKFTKQQVAPWMTKRTREISDSLLRFHNQIIEFCEYVSPTDGQHRLKQLALEQLTNVIKSVVPDCEVQAFGSFATGLYLPDGDVDVAVVVDVSDDRKIYQQIHSAILKCPDYEQVQYIRKSKVPLIKLLRTEGGIQFDISVNKQDGIKQIVQVRRMMECYPEFRYMAIVLKCTLKVRGLGETYSGGLGSFLLFSMLLVYLRDMQKRRKYYTLSEHILRFMEYYAIINDWSRKKVYVSTGQIEERRDEHTLSFISPQDDQHDIGKSAFRIKDVFGVFKNRFRMILGKNFKRGESVLKELVNPNESEFLYIKDK